MPDFLSFINEILWGSAMVYLLIGAGIWFTWRCRFVQFLPAWRPGFTLKDSLKPQSDGLSAMQALCTSMAARAGSGNLVGVALAISAGGPGAIFWMWISALLGMATSFAECSLAQLYKERDENGRFRGGPAWYMSRGLGMRWMGVMFSIFLLLAYGLIFNTVQANSIAQALNFGFAVPKFAIGLLLSALVLLTILRGLRGVARLMQWLVPVMVLVWVLAGVVVIFCHIEALPATLALIVNSAFGWHEAAAGATGYTLSQALSSGMQRSMFSNEAGIGSSPNVAAAASSWPPHPAAQGFMQMLGVFIDTFMICTASAAIILLANPVIDPTADMGVQLMQQAMTRLCGNWGPPFVALIVALFSFSSIVVNYLYAENNLVFLGLNRPRPLWILRLGTLLMIMAGTLLSLPLVWQVADMIMAMMALTNLTAILLLSPVVSVVARDWLRQRRLGVAPVFDPRRYPEIQRQLAPGSWDKPAGK